MGVAIAVQGFSYSLSGVTESAPNSAAIAPPPSAGTKAAGKGIYGGSVTLTFAPGTLASPSFTASATNTAPVVFTINPARIARCFVDGKAALGAGDKSVEVMVAGLMNAGSGTVPVAVPAFVTIINAGQVTVLAG
jgi:hypothetical protein